MVKTKPISIVITAYNEENYISSCLNSIVDQLIIGDEIIVIDNNSTDKTASIAMKFAQVRIVRENSQGISNSRNRGFNEAKNSIIARVDADTVVAENWVQIIREFYKTNGD